jgi:choline dehydrogenase-like flavoprotein
VAPYAETKTSASEPIPNLQLHSLPWAYPSPNQDAPGRPQVDKRPAITVMPTLIYPKSRGELRLLSADPQDSPSIDPHFLEDPADIELLMRGIELVREIMASSAIAGELKGELEPGPKFFEDAALRAELPNRVQTVYHPVGTCRMGVDGRSVVDPSLRVLGVEGLRVADASIMPSVIGGNTNAPCIMIGEKAADLLRA